MPRGTPKPLQAAFSLERRPRVFWRTKTQFSGKQQLPPFFFRQPGDSDLGPVATEANEGGELSPTPQRKGRASVPFPKKLPGTPKRAARTHRSPALLLAHPSRPSRLCTPRAGEEAREGPPARLPPRLPPAASPPHQLTRRSNSRRTPGEAASAPRDAAKLPPGARRQNWTVRIVGARRHPGARTATAASFPRRSRLRPLLALWADTCPRLFSLLAGSTQVAFSTPPSLPGKWGSSCKQFWECRKVTPEGCQG